MRACLLANFFTSVPCGTSTFTFTSSLLMWVTIMKKKSTVNIRSGIEATFSEGTVWRWVWNLLCMGR